MLRERLETDLRLAEGCLSRQTAAVAQAGEMADAGGKRSLGEVAARSAPAHVRGVRAAQAGYHPATLHHLPCRIDHDGPADVAGFFRPEWASGEPVDASQATDSSEFALATLRGRRLVGARVALPPGTHGFVMARAGTGAGGSLRKKRLATDGSALRDQGDAANADDAEDIDQWECTAAFDHVTFWNFDREPAASDEARRWEDWLPVADALHAI